MVDIMHVVNDNPLRTAQKLATVFTGQLNGDFKPSYTPDLQETRVDSQPVTTEGTELSTGKVDERRQNL